MTLLKVKNLNAFYGNSQVLFNMNLDITKNNNVSGLLNNKVNRKKIQTKRNGG